jgi:hypothetical protein
VLRIDIVLGAAIKITYRHATSLVMRQNAVIT